MHELFTRGDVAKEFEVVDVWLCRFPSEEAADRYFEETYDEDDDDRPISQFAADMGERFTNMTSWNAATSTTRRSKTSPTR